VTRVVLQELEGIISKHVKAAMIAEKNGDYRVAAYNLKKALEVLETLIRNYPDHPFVGVWKKAYYEYKKKLEYFEARLLVVAGGGSDEEYRVVINKDNGQVNDDEPPEFVIREKTDVTFDDIAGLEEAKEAIREAIIFPIRRPDLFPLGWPRGILLYGPPGTGKTMLAAAVANEVDGEFLYVDAASIMSKWLGEGEKNVRRLFEYARKKARKGTPVVIFIDEIDALLGVHSSEVGGEVRVRNQFLKEMDGLQDKSEKLHVYVIGATNKPWKLDEPFIRRFQKRIYVPLPNKEARLQMFRMLTKKINLAPDVDLEKLAEMTEGYNGSDIRDIVYDAYMRTVREYFQTGQGPRPVTMRDFEEAIRRRKPSVNKETLRLLEEWTKRFSAL